MAEVDVFDKNREAVSQLVRELKTFTFKQLVEAFKVKCPETYHLGIGGGWYLKDYLEHLESVNIIVEDFGDYSLLER